MRGRLRGGGGIGSVGLAEQLAECVWSGLRKRLAGCPTLGSGLCSRGPRVSSLAPVVRDGKTPRPAISAAPAEIGARVRYGDGVQLTITSVRQGRVGGQGPGVVEGAKTVFGLTLSNGSTRRVDLDRVVVTLVYDRDRVARPVYDDAERDFAGQVRPSRSAKATYAFAVPVEGRSAVRVVVDFDARHTAAVFRGSAR